MDEVKSLVRSLAGSIGQRYGGLNYTIFGGDQENRTDNVLWTC